MPTQIVATGALGADSVQPVTSERISIAQKRFGATPRYWGRYFTSPTTSGTAEYRHATEGPNLRASNISVLPIARQTKKVGGQATDGSRHGAANVDDFIDSFGAAYLQSLEQDFYLFLDVEGLPDLSADYYSGWSEAVISHSRSLLGNGHSLQPCLYASLGDQKSWDALSAAIRNGAVCDGLWVAKYPPLSGNEIPAWAPSLSPSSSNGPLPDVLLWQFEGGNVIDCSQVNPAVALADFLAHLAIPPAANH